MEFSPSIKVITSVYIQPLVQIIQVVKVADLAIFERAIPAVMMRIDILTKAEAPASVRVIWADCFLLAIIELVFADVA